MHEGSPTRDPRNKSRRITTCHDIISLHYRLRDDAYAVTVSDNKKEK